MSKVIAADRHAGEGLGLEELGVEHQTGIFELVGEMRANSHRLERALVPALVVDPHREIEHEQVLHDDDVALHVLDLRNLHHPAGAVAQPGEVDDEVDGR